MDPALLALSIPIFALTIPIVYIVVKSDIGKAFAQYLRSKSTPNNTVIDTVIKSEQLFLNLDERVRSLENDLKQIKDNTEFLHKLLIEKGASQQSAD